MNHKMILNFWKDKNISYTPKVNVGIMLTVYRQNRFVSVWAVPHGAIK